MTLMLHSQSLFQAVFDRLRNHPAVISFTRATVAGSELILPSLPAAAAGDMAAFDSLIAVLSDTSMSCLRPVTSLVLQPASVRIATVSAMKIFHVGLLWQSILSSLATWSHQVRFVQCQRSAVGLYRSWKKLLGNKKPPSAASIGVWDRSGVQPAVPRHFASGIHLILQDAPVLQDQVLVAIRHISV